MHRSLRCSRCDLKVLKFAEYKWAPEADYMFFRNYMPNVSEELRPNLRPAEGLVAYACQCSWCSKDSWGGKAPFDFWFACS